METVLQQLTKEIANNINDNFIWERDSNKVIDKIENLKIQGELIKNDLYLSLCMTVASDSNLHWLTDDEAEELYVTKELSSLPEYSPKTWVFIYYQMIGKFLKVFVSETGDVNKTPKENFAIAATQNKDFLRKNMSMLKPDANNFSKNKYEYLVNDDYIYKNTFENLYTLLNWAKSHYIEYDNFYKKIAINMTKSFADIHAEIRDDKYSETDERETLDINSFSKTLKQYNVPKHIINTIKGISYETIYFKTPVSFYDEYDKGVIIESAEDAGLGFLISIINYMHKEDLYNILTLYKTHLSNSWINGEQNKSEFRITKVDGKLILELEVRQNGIVYMLHNKE